MFNPNNRLRFAPGIVFNQSGAEGGGSGASQDGDTSKSGASQDGTNQDASKQGEYKAPWEKSGEAFDESRARTLLAAKDADEKKLKDRLTELETAQKAADDAKLTDHQRLEKERDEAKSGMSEAQLDTARLRAAIKFGLAEDDLEFINGKTPEAVLAAAERYAERHKDDTKKSLPSNRPRTGRGGSEPGTEPEEMDPRKLAASIPQLH